MAFIIGISPYSNALPKGGPLALRRSPIASQFEGQLDDTDLSTRDRSGGRLPPRESCFCLKIGMVLNQRFQSYAC